MFSTTSRAGGGGVLVVMHGRNRMTTDPRNSDAYLVPGIHEPDRRLATTMK